MKPPISPLRHRLHHPPVPSPRPSLLSSASTRHHLRPSLSSPRGAAPASTALSLTAVATASLTSPSLDPSSLAPDPARGRPGGGMGAWRPGRRGRQPGTAVRGAAKQEALWRSLGHARCPARCGLAWRTCMDSATDTSGWRTRRREGEAAAAAASSPATGHHREPARRLLLRTCIGGDERSDDDGLVATADVAHLRAEALGAHAHLAAAPPIGPPTPLAGASQRQPPL